MLHKLCLRAATFAVVLAFRVTAQVPVDCSRTYEVVADDTCDKISASENVSTFQLAHINEGVINEDCSNLFIGETICLGIEGQDCDTVHKVTEGQICWDIAEGASISLETLLANNPNVDSNCSNIYPDEVLCIASSVISYDT